jgi:hypothetical protein
MKTINMQNNTSDEDLMFLVNLGIKITRTPNGFVFHNTLDNHIGVFEYGTVVNFEDDDYTEAKEYIGEQYK